MQLIMHDTDIGGDSDDMAEAYVLNRLWDLGECRSLCDTVVQNYHDGSRFYTPGQCLEIAHDEFSMFYPPLGIVRDRTVSGLDTYATTIAAEYASWIHRYPDPNDIPNATTVWRQAMAKAPDASVHMVTTGTLVNLRLFYESPADGISPLTGAELIHQKVSELIILLGTYGFAEEDNYPEGDGGANLGDAWGNGIINVLAADELVRVVWTDIGYTHYFDVSAMSMCPLKRAVQLWAQDPPGSYRWHAWGPIAILYAVRGLAWGGTTYFHYSPKGKRTYTAPTSLHFEEGAGNQYFLYHDVSHATLGGICTDLMTHAALHYWSNTPYLPTITPDVIAGDTDIDPMVITGGKRLTGATAVDLGPGFTVDSFNVDSDTQITIHPSRCEGGSIGFNDVTVTTPSGVGRHDFALELSSLWILIDLALLAEAISFKEIENIGTWGVDIDVTSLGEYQVLDGDAVTFQETPFTPDSWNEINFQIGSTIQFNQIGLNCDWILEAFEAALALDVTPTDLWLMIPSFYYDPPLGDWVNFQLTPYTPVAYNEVNWYWPLHSYVDFTDAVDADAAFGAITFLTEQFLSMSEVPVSITFPEIDLYIVFYILDQTIDFSNAINVDLYILAEIFIDSGTILHLRCTVQGADLLQGTVESALMLAEAVTSASLLQVSDDAHEVLRTEVEADDLYKAIADGGELR